MLLPLRGTAFLDQYKAASADARKGLEVAVPLGGLRHPWLAAQVAELKRAVRSRVGEACSHLTTPTVVHAAAWAPGRLVCSACTAHLVAGYPACDHCGKATDRVCTGLCVVGPIQLAFRLCLACWALTGRGSS